MLRRNYSGFRVQDICNPERAGVIGCMRTNSNKTYVLWIPLQGFPDSAPPMYVVEPQGLLDCDGQLLSEKGASSSFHLLSPKNGSIQICHYNDQFWSDAVTLSKVLMKGRLWLEAYEQHMRSGKAISHYLPHMSGR